MKKKKRRKKKKATCHTPARWKTSEQYKWLINMVLWQVTSHLQCHWAESVAILLHSFVTVSHSCMLHHKGLAQLLHHALYGTITPYFHITKQACHTLKSSLILVTTKTCHIVRCTVTLSNDHCNRLTQMILKLHMTTNTKLGGTKDTIVSYCHIVYNETS